MAAVTLRPENHLSLWLSPGARVTPILAHGEVKGVPLITTAVHPLGAQTLPLIPHSIKMRWEEQTQRTMEYVCMAYSVWQVLTLGSSSDLLPGARDHPGCFSPSSTIQYLVRALQNRPYQPDQGQRQTGVPAPVDSS